MRLFILILGSLEALLLIFGIVMSILEARHTDLAGAGLANASTVLMALVLLLFVLPPILLAYSTKNLWLALVLLAIATIIIVGVLMLR